MFIYFQFEEDGQVLVETEARLKALVKKVLLINNNKTNEDLDLQLSFFNLDNPKLEELKEDILSLDIDELTPVEALIKLNEIK